MAQSVVSEKNVNSHVGAFGEFQHYGEAEGNTELEIFKRKYISGLITLDSYEVLPVIEQKTPAQTNIKRNVKK